MVMLLLMITISAIPALRLLGDCQLYCIRAGCSLRRRSSPPGEVRHGACGDRARAIGRGRCACSTPSRCFVFPADARLAHGISAIIAARTSGTSFPPYGRGRGGAQGKAGWRCGEGAVPQPVPTPSRRRALLAERGPLRCRCTLRRRCLSTRISHRAGHDRSAGVGRIVRPDAPVVGLRHSTFHQPHPLHLLSLSLHLSLSLSTAPARTCRHSRRAPAPDSLAVRLCPAPRTLPPYYPLPLGPPARTRARRGERAGRTSPAHLRAPGTSRPWPASSRTMTRT